LEDALFAVAAALSAGGGVSSERRGGGGGADAALSEAVFWLTNVPKMSFAGDWSDRVVHCGAAWKAAFAMASGVTLNTGRSPMELPLMSKDRAIAGLEKYQYFSISYNIT
jgi:hypothetical protein